MAKFEAEAISQMFDNGKRLQSKHATTKQVEDALSGEYSVFHFTGHGTYNFSNPQKSELALAEATQWLRHLTVQQLKEWYEAFLTQLPPNELRIRAFVETELYRLGRMEPDRKLYDRPYYWAAFTITGKPC